jgi:penicillin-binding protein 1C
VERPDELGQWNQFSTQAPVAWKTGTSHGFRDAWAIGVETKYTIGVWVGNSDGSGRAGLLGAKVAAPILFALFNHLGFSESKSFSAPYDELIPMATCSVSGLKAGPDCPTIDTILVDRFPNATLPCHYHQKIWINEAGWRIQSGCNTNSIVKSKSIFHLDPIPEYYYALRNAQYEKMPPIDPSCQTIASDSPMSMIQPKEDANLFIPKDKEGRPGKVVFTLAHRNPETPVFWHLDGNYLSTTRSIHEIGLTPSEGKHTLTLVDSSGNEIKCSFVILGSNQ